MTTFIKTLFYPNLQHILREKQYEQFKKTNQKHGAYSSKKHR